MRITVRHRSVEVDKFATIANIERLLGVFDVCVISAPKPRPSRLLSTFDYRDMCTSTFTCACALALTLR
jgi:hypothetical protein